MAREAFDQMPAGYHGPLYTEISPKTFTIVVRQGSRLDSSPAAAPSQDERQRSLPMRS